LFAGADLKLCTASASFAMPENQIGFYPDVGAAYFLQKPNWKQGTFLGLAGFPITAQEALALSYVDDVITSDYADVLKTQLARGIDAVELDIQSAGKDIAAIRAEWKEALNLLPDNASLSDWVSLIEEHSDDFACFRRAKQSWMTASAWSLAVTWHFFAQMRDADRAEVLARDTIVGANFCANSEFFEGVHAKLIDKNRLPKWQYPHEESVPIEDIMAVLDQPSEPESN
jgi:enoyl-CoA hydratase/carnithine racemase